MAMWKPDTLLWSTPGKAGEQTEEGITVLGYTSHSRMMAQKAHRDEM